MKIILTSLLAVALLASSPVFATGGGGSKKGGDCNGISNCNQNKSHHNVYGDVDNSRDNNAYGGQGGRGGQGGKGGTGYGGSAYSGAIAGAAAGVNRSGNSDVDIRNRNRNTNKQGQGQGQLQGQLQGQIGINEQGQSQSGYNSQGQVGINKAVGAGNTTTFTDNSVYEAQKRNPVAPAWAAPLTASEDTCMGSTSAGGQGITIGLSFATTWRDGDCVRRKDARFLHNSQRPLLSLAVLCDNSRVQKAAARVGTADERRACGVEEEAPVADTSAEAPADAVVTTDAELPAWFSSND